MPTAKYELKKYNQLLGHKKGAVKSLKNSIGAARQLKELLSLYPEGEDIAMIKNLVEHSAFSSGHSSGNPFEKNAQAEPLPAEYSLSANYPNPFNPAGWEREDG